MEGSAVSGVERGNMSVSGGGDHCSGGGKSGVRGIIIAGWGTAENTNVLLISILIFLLLKSEFFIRIVLKY